MVRSCVWVGLCKFRISSFDLSHPNLLNDGTKRSNYAIR
jgi:hypothetical protein